MSSALRISIGANITLLTLAGILVVREHLYSPPPHRAVVAPPAPERPDAAPRPAAIESDAHRRGEARLTPQAIVRLEEQGLSRGLVTEILLQDFNQRWDQRVDELQRRYDPMPVPDREYVELGRHRDAELIRELKAALGEDGYLAWDKEQTLRNVNGGGLAMDPAEADQVYALQKQLDDQIRELQMAMEDGIADKADAGTLQARAQQEFEAQVEALLGRKRYEQLRGLVSPAADNPMFASLSLTGAQSAALTRAESEYRAREADLAKRLKENPVDAARLSAELTALNDAREAEFRVAIGSEAYEQLKREHDTTYQTLKQYADAWNLQDAELQPVYETLTSLRDQARRTRSAAHMREAAGHDVDWKSVETAIEEARRQAESGLSVLLGGERLRRLKQNGLLMTP